MIKNYLKPNIIFYLVIFGSIKIFHHCLFKYNHNFPQFQFSINLNFIDSIVLYLTKYFHKFNIFIQYFKKILKYQYYFYVNRRSNLLN